MTLYDLLQSPLLYNLKTRILSLGRRNIRNYLSTKVHLPPNGAILDVGCGTGNHAETFRGSFRPIVCLAMET